MTLSDYDLGIPRFEGKAMHAGTTRRERQMRMSMTVVSVGFTFVLCCNTGRGQRLDLLHTTAQLSRPRYDLAATSVGAKAMFGGGGEQNYEVFDNVDVYDFATKSWSLSHLATPRMSLAATTVGNTAIFAGGAPDYHSHESLDAVDLYNDVTAQWTTAHLSSPRNRLAATSLGDRAYISGGVVETSGGYPSVISSVIDVYDASAGTWSTMSMPRARYAHSSVAVGGRLLFLSLIHI